MSDQTTKPVPIDTRTNQERHFDELYGVFFAFYQDALRADVPPHVKVRLVLTTQFFDDVNLQKLVFPIFEKFPSNVEDKRAVARAAYYDALTLHNRTAGMNFVSVPEKEKHNL